MSYRPEAPLIVQGDRSVLLDVHHPRYENARDALIRFAELEKSPEHLHTYRISSLSLWNAAASGVSIEWIEAQLEAFSRYDVPENLLVDIRQYMQRYGLVQLHRSEGDLLELRVQDPFVAKEFALSEQLSAYWRSTIAPGCFLIDFADRGNVKQALIKLGYPVEDHVGFTSGESLPVNLLETTHGGRPFELRAYQQEASEIFTRSSASKGGHGVIVLPCGSGKTIVGLGVMAALGMRTLILTTNRTSVKQWREEILDKTDLLEPQIGEYTGHSKEIRPVTLSTYQMLTHRASKEGRFTHHHLFTDDNWGLIIYDEVHLLPAPVFRATASIQGKRRLGLTATLVREDGLETDVFSLIGPKRLDVPWKELESQGFIAEAHCHEIRIGMTAATRLAYATAPPRQQYRVAAENPLKLEVVQSLLAKHAHDQVLVIGQYLEQLAELARVLGAPLITGQVKQEERDRLYAAFRSKEIRVLVVSKVANFAVDLPDANVAIQVSGTYGSRQEEAQRLGRILRPKEAPSYFYSLVTGQTTEAEFAMNRQRFLTEQGYRYHIRQWEDDEPVGVSACDKTIS